MIEWPLAIAGGLLGSAHCAGMCGGFAVTLGAHASTWRQNLVRQCIFGGGRLSSYVSLGAAAGYGGARLIALVDRFDARSWLALAAGMLLVWQGLKAAGYSIGRRRSGVGVPTCVRPGLLGGLLRTRGSTAALAAGVLTGLLPCGLVYSFLVLAATAGGMGSGMGIMACFGLGTLPMMTALGLGASLLSMAGRRRMLQAAAWCVVFTGLVSAARGATGLLDRSEPPEGKGAHCPFCAAADDKSPNR